MTSIFIYIIIAVIIGFDIYLAVKKKKTITEVFRGWYKGFPFVPYAVGAIFIGHIGAWIPFGWMPNKLRIILFVVLSVAFLVWNIIEKIRLNKSRAYNLFCKIFLVPMVIGAVIGSLWY